MREGRRLVPDGPVPGGDWSRLFESLPIGAYRSTPDGRLLRANPALVRMNGYTQEAELVQAVRDAAVEWYVEPGRRAELQARLARDGTVSGFVSEVRRHRGGERLWVSESATVVRDEAGRPLHYEGTVEDITDQVRARQALEREELYRRQLSDQLPGMLYRVRVAPDGRQRFEYVSAGVERVYGVSVDEVMRDAGVLARMRHPDDSAAVDAALGAAHAAAAPHSAEFRVLHRDGSLRWVHMLSVPVAEEPGGDVRTGIVLDLTERHLAQQMREERDRAEARRRATSALMSRISHELRTPLNAVLGFAQLLEQEPGLADHQRAWLGHVVDSGRHLLALVEDVLDLARVDGGELVLRPVDADVSEAVRANWAMLAADAAASEVTLAPLPPALPRVHADPLRLRQVLGNLLSNAIKYNRRGGEVRLAAERRGGEVGIAVSDSGAGLDAAQVERLFMPFERLGAEHGPVSGTGLGLALSRQLTQAMGGRIEVHSTPGQGSCFTVWLPAARGGD